MEIVIRSITEAGVCIIFCALVGFIIGVVKISIEKALDIGFGEDKKELAMNKLTFLGVIHHELAHALIFMLTGAKVVKITLFKLHPRDDYLGNVQVIARGPKLLQNIQYTLGSTAPVYMGIGTLMILKYFIDISDGKIQAFFYYVAFSIVAHMDLSDKDIKLAIKGAPFIFGLLVIIFLLINVLTNIL